MKKEKKGQNFFEMIPRKSEKIQWKINDNGIIQLIIWRDSKLDKIVRKIFRTPEKTTVDLDEIGSVVWNAIDGENNIFEISKIIKEELGEKIEPLNERLITYMNILKNNDFIKLDAK